MSDTSNASLVLKTGDIVDTLVNPIPTATLTGYLSDATTFQVATTVGTTLIAADVNYILSGLPSQVAPPTSYVSATFAGTNPYNAATGYGALTLATAQTPSVPTAAGQFTAAGIAIFVAPTTTQTGCTIALTTLTLGALNAAVVQGMVLTCATIATVQAGTTIVSGAGLTWVVSISQTVASSTLNFVTLVPGIAAGNVISGAGFNEAIVLDGPNISTTSVSYRTNHTQTVAVAELVTFYPTIPLLAISYNPTDATTVIPAGSCNNLRTRITWNNINLRTCLGEMYEKYDLFNICLNTVSTAQPPASISTSPDNLQIMFKLSGLPLVNQTYNQLSGHNEMSTNIGSMTFPANAAVTQYFYSNNIATFGKSCEMCSISIEYLRVIDNTNPNTLGAFPYVTPAAVSPFPHMMFLFDIVGIQKERGNLNGTRMKIPR